MNHMKTVLFGLLLMFSATSMSMKALNLKVLVPDDLTFNSDNQFPDYLGYDQFQPVYLAPQLFFVVSEPGEFNRENNQLWSYNTDTQEMTNLQIPNVIMLQQFKNQVLVVTNDETYYNYGTLYYYYYKIQVRRLDSHLNSHSILVNDDFWTFFSLISNQNNFYIGGYSDYLQYDGETITPINNPFGDTTGEPSICENTQNGVSTITNNGFSGTFFNNTFSAKPIDELLAYRSSTFYWDSHFTAFDNSCYYTSRDNINNPYRLKFAITETSTIGFLDNELVQKLSGFTVLEDKLFAIEYQQDAIMYTIHQLDGLTMESLNHVDVMLSEPLKSGTVPVLSSNAAYLITGTPNVKLFDADLQAIELNNYNASDPIKLYYNGYHTPLGDALVINNVHFSNQFAYDYPFPVIDETYAHNLHYYTYIAESYSWDVDIQPQKVTKQPVRQFAVIEDNQVSYRYQANDDFYIDKLYVNPSSEIITMVAYDKQTGTSGLYQLEEQPQINHLINGSWFSPEFPNQGLSIAKGTRQDGSEYIYLTVYTFRDGQPLWLAGVADLVGQPNEIEVTLYEYDGAEFLQPQQNPNQQQFGSIHLSFSGCNSLQAEINGEQTTQSIGFVRAENKEYERWCQ